jgi:hypothetical protein
MGTLLLALSHLPFHVSHCCCLASQERPARSSRMGSGTERVVYAERPAFICLPALWPLDTSTGEGCGEAVESLRSLTCPLASQCRSKTCVETFIFFAGNRINCSSSTTSDSVYPSLPAFASRLARSLALMVSSRSAVARSRNWWLAHLSIFLPCVLRSNAREMGRLQRFRPGEQHLRG